jgi:hypothetical protein
VLEKTGVVEGIVSGGATNGDAFLVLAMNLDTVSLTYQNDLTNSWSNESELGSTMGTLKVK